MSEQDDQLIAKRVFTMQVINLALVMGVVVFLGIVIYMVYGPQQGRGSRPGEELPIISLVAAAMLVPGAILSFLLPGIFVNVALGKIAAGTWRPPQGADPKDFESDAAKLLVARQMGLVIGLALLEGPAFTACVAFLMEAHIWALALAMVALILLLVRFPTQGGMRVWTQEQLDRLNAMRSG